MPREIVMSPKDTVRCRSLLLVLAVLLLAVAVLGALHGVPPAILRRLLLRLLGSPVVPGGSFLGALVGGAAWAACEAALLPGQPIRGREVFLLTLLGGDLGIGLSALWESLWGSPGIGEFWAAFASGGLAALFFAIFLAIDHRSPQSGKPTRILPGVGGDGNTR
jgi:hypothetical protein